MNFNNNERYIRQFGQHALFTASQSAWLRYEDEKIYDYIASKKAAVTGTLYHAWAANTIKLGILQQNSDDYLAMYVNDAIRFGMQPEVTLFYTKNFFGTADTISFRNNILRIHDLKTGITGTPEQHIDQLEIYAALFFLEYRMHPKDVEVELRVYKKHHPVLTYNPGIDDIIPVMDRIIYIDRLVNNYDATQYENELQFDK